MSDTMTREQRHYCMSRIRGEGHTAGDGGAEIPACLRFSVLAAFEEVAGVSGHCAAEVPHGDIHKWVFLAWASRV